MSPHVRYSEPPEFVIHYPTCSACDIDLDHDGDGWECPKCGTQWDSSAADGDRGELYESWSGEEPDAPIVTHDEGWKVAWIEHAYQPWLTSGNFDMGRCLKCCQPKVMHVGSAS